VALVENDATPLVFVVEVRSASIACQDWFSRKHSTVTPDTGLPLESLMVTLQDAVAPFAMFCPLFVMAVMERGAKRGVRHRSRIRLLRRIRSGVFCSPDIVCPTIRDGISEVVSRAHASGSSTAEIGSLVDQRRG
jgi:hypothetical protein